MEAIETRLPDVPLGSGVAPVNVCVEPARIRIEMAVGVPVVSIFANVLFPVMSNVPLPPIVKRSVFHVFPPPANFLVVADVSARQITDVPAFTVSPDDGSLRD